MEILDKKYNIIYADPPWWYNKRKNPEAKFSRGVHSHYSVMRDEEILALPVSKLADDNCALLMWATCPKLPTACQVVEKWGFRYSTVAFCWVKINKNNRAPVFGPGYYTASNIEIVILGMKGSLSPVDNTISQLIIEDRMEHSHKPAIVREKIVQLFGDLPRIELFARQTAPGWDGWGKEYEGAGAAEPIQDKLFGDVL